MRVAREDDAFFEMFYSNFLSQSDEIAALFKNTDWPHQIRLIRKALHSAIIFAQNHEISPAKKHMEAIAYSHSREYMNIKPEYYPMWLEAMLRTLKERDPYFSPELEKAWREVLTFLHRFYDLKI